MANNRKNLNVPNLRFSEFEGEWGWHKLRDIANISKGFGIFKDQLSEQGQPCILYGELYTKYKSEVIQKIISCTDIDNRNLVKSQVNDVIIPSSRETAIDIATARYIPFSGILLGGDLNIIRLKKDNGGFLSYQLNGIRKRDIAKVAQGVSVIHLYGESLKKLDVTICSREEQNKIARFLSLLDKRILTQIKIIEQYKSLIKGLSCYIFGGIKANTKPVFFSELYTTAKEGGTPDTKNTDYYEDGKIPFIKIDDLKGKYLERNQWYITETGLKNSSAWIIPANSIIYSNGATIGLISINKYPVTTKQGILGVVIKDKVSLEYIFYYMSSDYFRQEIRRITTHGTIPTAYIKDIDTIKCYLPEYEQQKNVVKILDVLTEKIEAERSMLSAYQTQKTYLRANMFI